MTRNLFLYRKYIDCTKSNYYCCQPYVSQSKGHGFCSTTTGRGAFQCGRQVGSLRQHLEGVDKGQLGITDHQRVPNSLCRATCTGEEAKRAFLSSRATSPDTGRGLLSAGERGSNSSRQLPPQTEFYSVLFLVPKKSGQMRPVINLKALNQWVETPPLQDGGLDHSPGPAEAGRLVSKGGPEGCLPHGTSTSRPPMLPTVHRRGSRLPVHLPSLRASMCPMGLHQGDEGCGDPTPVLGDQDNHLHQRHLSHVGVCSTGSTALGGANSHPTMPEVHHQYREIGDDPSPGDRILGHDGEHQHSASQLPSRESEADSGRGHQNLQNYLSVSPAVLPFPGETQCSYSSCSPCPTILLLLTEGPPSSSSRQQPGLQDFPVPFTSSPGRAILVERTPPQMEWETYQEETGASNNQLRCLPDGLGSSLCRDTHRRCLVNTGASHAHQLPGAFSSHTGSEGLPEGGFRDLGTPLGGQCHSSGIHQQHGGYSVKPADRPGEGTLDVGSGQGHNSVSPTHTRGVQHHSGHGITDNSEQVRLDALSPHLSGYQEGIRSTGCGPVCLQTDIPNTSFLQLETRPSGRGAQDWSPLRGFVNPPWCLIGRVLSHACCQVALLVLVAPVWRGQT